MWVYWVLLMGGLLLVADVYVFIITEADHFADFSFWIRLYRL